MTSQEFLSVESRLNALESNIARLVQAGAESPAHPGFAVIAYARGIVSSLRERQVGSVAPAFSAMSFANVDAVLKSAETQVNAVLNPALQPSVAALLRRVETAVLSIGDNAATIPVTRQATLLNAAAALNSRLRADGAFQGAEALVVALERDAGVKAAPSSGAGAAKPGTTLQKVDATIAQTLAAKAPSSSTPSWVLPTASVVGAGALLWYLWRRSERRR